MPKRKAGLEPPANVIAALTKPHPRVECYGRVIASGQDSLAGFMRAHPDWAGDVRSQAAAEFFTLFVGMVLDEILDDYHIGYLADREDPE